MDAGALPAPRTRMRAAARSRASSADEAHRAQGEVAVHEVAYQRIREPREHEPVRKQPATERSTGAEQGTGLGLPIVQGLIALHGGEFDLRSKLRRGNRGDRQCFRRRACWKHCPRRPACKRALSLWEISGSGHGGEARGHQRGSLDDAGGERGAHPFAMVQPEDRAAARGRACPQPWQVPDRRAAAASRQWPRMSGLTARSTQAAAMAP